MDSNDGDATKRGEASLIDLVIPVYNGAELLKTREQELLELAEKNSDLRIYIVDDGSEDEFTVASKMLVNHSRISVVCLSENKGRAVARNSGASAGAAPFICFVDVDCELCPDWLCELRNAIKMGNQLVFGRVECKGSNFWSRYVNDVYRSRESCFDGGVSSLSSQIFMVRRDHYEKCGGFFEGYRYYGFEDRDFFNLLVVGEELRPVLSRALVVWHEPEVGPSAICGKMYIGGKHSAALYADRFPVSYRQSKYWYFDFRHHGRLYVVCLFLLTFLYDPLLKLPDGFYGSKLIPYSFKKPVAKLLFALAFARGTRDSSS